MTAHRPIEFQDEVLLELGAQMEPLLRRLRAFCTDKGAGNDAADLLYAQLRPIENSLIAIPAQTRCTPQLSIAMACSSRFSVSNASPFTS